MKVHLDWIDSEIFERPDAPTFLEGAQRHLVPGGFGVERGTEGKIHAVQFARGRKVPFFGICYGLHMAVIEAARDLAGLDCNGTSEYRPSQRRRHRSDDRIDQGHEKETRSEGGDLGGTMRLGAYTAVRRPGSRAQRSLAAPPRSASATATRSTPNTPRC